MFGRRGRRWHRQECLCYVTSSRRFRLVRMDFWARAITTLVLIGAINGRTTPHRPQDAHSSKPAEGAATLIKVNNAVYPPLARQARITGDVVVAVEIESDGRIRSASVV